MDILKRRSAPITAAAWEEIDSTAKDVIINHLSGRKVIEVNGPYGWDFTSVNEGRLVELDKQTKEGEVHTGTYKLKPLVEARVSFKLNKWELDNIERGSKDINLDALEEACEKLALFEEEAIYNGYKKGEIKGLSEVKTHKIKLGNDGKTILQGIGEAKYILMSAYAEGPYDLIVSQGVYEKLNSIYEGAYLFDFVEKIIGGSIIRSKVIKGAVMIPHKDEDFELTVGQDFAIGYEKETDQEVQLFVTESFTFRILDENKVVVFSE